MSVSVSHKTSKKKPKFSKVETEILRMKLLNEKYGILPVEVNEDGYWNDGLDSVKRIKKTTGKHNEHST